MSDDDLLSELDLGGGGPRLPKTPLEVNYVRDLSPADIAALSSATPQPPKSLKRIHSSHHSLARCLAAGMKPGQASLVTGYDNCRISVLQNDPAFRALVEDYRLEAKATFADLAERMSDVSLDALEILHERLQDAPEDFSVPMLLDVVKSFADRTGHGPGSELSVKLGGDFIDRPPRESYEDWAARRAKELGPAPGGKVEGEVDAGSPPGKAAVLRLVPPGQSPKEGG